MLRRAKEEEEEDVEVKAIVCLSTSERFLYHVDYCICFVRIDVVCWIIQV